MSKKDFKNHIEDLFRDGNEENKPNEQQNQQQNEEKFTGINLDEITDEKLKWLLIKLNRYEKELKLWRTGKLTQTAFLQSLKKFNLTYDIQTNQIKKAE